MFIQWIGKRLSRTVTSGDSDRNRCTKRGRHFSLWLLVDCELYHAHFLDCFFAHPQT